MFGVYYEDAPDASGHGPQWCVRLYDDSWRGWWRSWPDAWRRHGWRSLVHYVHPIADPDVVDEMARVFRVDDRIHDLCVEPLD